eukprot:511671_1
MNCHIYGLVIICISAISGHGSRERHSMNFNWLFNLGSQNIDHISCNASSFEMKKNKACQGLTLMHSAHNNNPNECANLCCANPTCSFFQISDTGDCYIGNNISIYIPFDWVTSCAYFPGYTFYSRSNIPDTNPTHFNAALKSYDDSNWQNINLPHDYIINGNVTYIVGDSKHEYLPKNTSWYRKHFSLPESYKNATIFIDFDGIFTDSVTFINGHFVGNHSTPHSTWSLAAIDFLT